MEGCTEISLTDLGYDAIGRIHEDRRNGVANMKTTYSYNVRSWLTGLSNLKFSEALYYNVKRSSGQSAACWSGNISGMEWAFNGGNDNYSYDFSYDKLHRLTDAQYDDDLGYGDAYSTNYGYDKNGNINSIMRQAWSIDDEPAPLDEMTLYYTGNQLQSAQSYADPDLFVDYYPYEMLQTSSPFAYDGNGNTTKDLHKNISRIEYNILNLPRRITYTDGSTATYTYSSLGEKLQVVYSTSRQTAVQPATGVLGTAAEAREEATRSVTSTTDYCGDIIYNGSSVSRILLDGKGYLTLSGSTPTYYFFMKDHLGNTRAVVNQSGTVKQEYQYYPFGKRWDDVYEYFKQPYQYNGKEMDEMHGLRWLDYGARMYEPALGRFMTMDPMAEKYYSISPYAYCANNPVRYIDVDGKEPGDFFRTKDEAAKDEFNKVEDTQKTEKEEINIIPYELKQTDNYFTVETKVEKYLSNNNFILDIIYEGEKKVPKIIGKLGTIINPKIFNIDFYSSIDQSDKLGREINIMFNNITSNVNFIYDAGLNQATIITNFLFDEYTIKTQYYEEKTRTITRNIGGMIITIPDVKEKVNLDTPDEEKFRVIPLKNKTIIENYNY